MTRDIHPAALRILESLPRERIRTHTRDFYQPIPPGPKRVGPLPQALIEEYARLRESGTGYHDTRRALCVGNGTMKRLAKATGR